MLRSARGAGRDRRRRSRGREVSEPTIIPADCAVASAIMTEYLGPCNSDVMGSIAARHRELGKREGRAEIVRYLRIQGDIALRSRESESHEWYHAVADELEREGAADATG